MSTTPLPPRLVHNERLAKQWLQDKNIKFSVPPVSSQIRTIPLNRRALPSFAYNPSIIRFNNKWLCAARHHFEGRIATALSLAELDENFNVTVHRPIELVGNMSYEDPLLFTHKDQLHIAYTEATPRQNDPKCFVRYGQLVRRSTWNIDGQWQLNYAENDGLHMVKNLCFFSHGDRLFVIYQSFPEQIVLEIEDNKVINEYRSPSLRWAWGPLRGRSSPLPYRDSFLRVVHSSLDNEARPWARRYYVGALLMDPQPPFTQRAISKEPIVRGSEVDDTTVTERSSCVCWKANVIFPGGLAAIKGGWLVSCGVNDAQCVLLHLKEDDLKL